MRPTDLRDWEPMRQDIVFCSSSNILKVSITDSCRQNLGEDGVKVSHLVVDHKSKKTHLSGTSIVQFNGTLLKLGGIIVLVPAEVNGSILWRNKWRCELVYLVRG